MEWAILFWLIVMFFMQCIALDKMNDILDAIKALKKEE